jgi:L-ribulokinase
LRLVWDHGDRTVLAQPHVSGATFGWRLSHTAADELFAAMEGTALHTRIILERLSEYGVPIERVIHTGGIPRRSAVINRIYASALDVPILLPEQDTTSLGAAIFAFLAAGAFRSIEEAQQALCPKLGSVEPEPRSVEIYRDLFGHFRELYFALGNEESAPIPVGKLLSALRRIAASAAM